MTAARTFERRPTVLIVAASDSSGGSGLQADLRVCAALGVHPLTVVTAVTAQTPTVLESYFELSAAAVRAQLSAVESVGVDAVKIGLIANPAVAARVVDWLAQRALEAVVDPVAGTSGGAEFGDRASRREVFEQLAPRACLITPNRPEFEELAAGRPTGRVALIAAARALRPRHGALLLKGGHGTSELCTDLLVGAQSVREFTHRRLGGRPKRGTGCALSTAIACFLAHGKVLEAAVEEGIGYVQHALTEATPLGDRVSVI